MENIKMNAAIITASDSGYAGQREDLSGPAIREMITAAGYTVVKSLLLPDDRQMLKEAMAQIADHNEACLILTTGGTGFSQRDCMPEATMDVAERLVPAFLRPCGLTACRSPKGLCFPVRPAGSVKIR